MSPEGAFRIFGEGELRNHLTAVVGDLRRRVEADNADYILNVNESEYVDFLVNAYEIEPLTLDFAKVSVSDQERDIAAEMFPGGGFDFNVMRGAHYRKHVITYHIPFAGEAGCCGSRRVVALSGRRRCTHKTVVCVSM